MIAQAIKNFVLGVTGNSELTKEVLAKQFNYMVVEEKPIGIPFLKRILKKVELQSSIEFIEERFLSSEDKAFLVMIIESLTKGHKVHVQKIKAVESKEQPQKLSLQDREHVNTVFDMFNGQHSRQLIEFVYHKNAKDFEATLDQFLTNNIPKDEYKVVVIPKPDVEMIDTSSKIQEQSELLQLYMLGQFQGSTKRKNLNKRYYDE